MTSYSSKLSKNGRNADVCISHDDTYLICIYSEGMEFKLTEVWYGKSHLVYCDATTENIKCKFTIARNGIVSNVAIDNCLERLCDHDNAAYIKAIMLDHCIHN